MLEVGAGLVDRNDARPGARVGDFLGFYNGSIAQSGLLESGPDGHNHAGVVDS